MKVILLETSNEHGLVGDVINVKPGYARNYLIPQGKAVLANEQNIKQLNHQKRILDHKLAKAREASEQAAKKLGRFKLTIAKPVGAKDKLFGTVTTAEISAELAKNAKIEIERRNIRLTEPIKKLGNYRVQLKLDGGVDTELSLRVVSESSDASDS